MGVMKKKQKISPSDIYEYARNPKGYELNHGKTKVREIEKLLSSTDIGGKFYAHTVIADEKEKILKEKIEKYFRETGEDNPKKRKEAHIWSDEDEIQYIKKLEKGWVKKDKGRKTKTGFSTLSEIFKINFFEHKSGFIALAALIFLIAGNIYQFLESKKMSQEFQNFQEGIAGNIQLEFKADKNKKSIIVLLKGISRNEREKKDIKLAELKYLNKNQINILLKGNKEEFALRFDSREKGKEKSKSKLDFKKFNEQKSENVKVRITPEELRIIEDNLKKK